MLQTVAGAYLGLKAKYIKVSDVLGFVLETIIPCQMYILSPSHYFNKRDLKVSSFCLLNTTTFVVRINWVKHMMLKDISKLLKELL